MSNILPKTPDNRTPIPEPDSIGDRPRYERRRADGCDGLALSLAATSESGAHARVRLIFRLWSDGREETAGV